MSLVAADLISFPLRSFKDSPSWGAKEGVTPTFLLTSLAGCLRRFQLVKPPEFEDRQDTPVVARFWPELDGEVVGVIGNDGKCDWSAISGSAKKNTPAGKLYSCLESFGYEDGALDGAMQCGLRNLSQVRYEDENGHSLNAEDLNGDYSNVHQVFLGNTSDGSGARMYVLKNGSDAVFFPINKKETLPQIRVFRPSMNGFLPCTLASSIPGIMRKIFEVVGMALMQVSGGFLGGSAFAVAAAFFGGNPVGWVAFGISFGAVLFLLAIGGIVYGISFLLPMRH